MPTIEDIRQRVLLNALAREFGFNPAVVHRWGERGVPRPDGGREHLTRFRIGGRWYTTRDAFEAFVAKLTAAHQRGQQGSRTVAPPSNNKSHQAADAALAAAGW